MTTNEELALTDATAELAIAQIYVLPETIQAEDAVTLGADVRNDGTAESGAFQVRFTLDNSETHDVEFSTIPPGASHWEEWMHEPLTPGEHLLAVQLDVQDQVREGNKYDNAASLAFQVMAAPTYENMTSDDAEATESDDDEALTSDDSGKKKKKGKPKVIDLGTIEVKVPVEHLPPGKSSEEQISTRLDDLKIWIVRYWENYRDGLQNFADTMDHATFDPAEEDKVQGILKSVGIGLLDKLLDTVGEIPGPWSIVAKGVKAAGHLWLDHKEQVAKKEAEDKKAQGEVKFGEYIKSFRKAIGNTEDQWIQKVTESEMPLAQELARIMKEDGDSQPTPDGVFVGEGAKFLKQLGKQVEAFKKAIPPTTAFELEFTERFASQPGWTKTPFKGGRPFALYFKFKLTRDLEWKVEEHSQAWTLASESSKAQTLAKELEAELKENGQMPWQAEHVHKIVEMDFEDEIGTPKKWSGAVHFDASPDNAEFKSWNGYPSEMEKVWARPDIRKIVIENDKIVGSSN